MSVLKAKRKPSQFEVFHHFYKMRKEITDLLLRDFGYDLERADSKALKMFGGKPYEELTPEEKARYDIQKINPKRLTGMRRKMKKLAPKLSEKEFTDWYKSWFKNHYRIMSRQQRSNMDTLFNQLKEVTKCSTQSPSPMVAS